MLDYVIDNSELIGEWNWEKNNTLGFYPQKLSCGSGKKVWWKCQKGHEWQAVIGSRNNGYGCPFCSGLRVLRGVNDLETVNPELCKEWNYKRNIGISPDLFFPNSDKKVWWKCELGHEWQASIGHRNKGRGCPICAGKQVLTGFNDLASTNPEVAKEWEVERNMGVTPENVTPNSHKKAWWKCSVCGNEWQAIISERNRGYGCPKCGVRKMAHSRRCNQIEEKGSLEQNNPDLAKEWLYAKNGELKPSDVLQNSPQKVWWKCRDCGHEWAAQIKSRNSGHSCPKCAQTNNALSYSRTMRSISQRYPDLVTEWDSEKNGTTPDQSFCKAETVVWWKCQSCGNHWQAKINLRAAGQGCPKCLRVMRTSFPEQAIFFYVSKAYPDAINGYTDIFANGMELDIYIPSLRLGIEYDGIAWHNSSTTYEREKTKYRICKENGIHLIRIKENHLHNSGDTCDTLFIADVELDNTIRNLFQYLHIDCDIACDRDRTAIQENYRSQLKSGSIALKNPELALEWHPTKNGNLTPDMFQPHVSQKVWWQCKNGHEWEATIASRSDGCGCPFCSGRVAIEGENDLATLFPQIAAEWLYTRNGNLTPDSVVPGSNKLVWWQCSSCKNEWRARIKDRTLGKKCPHCGKKSLVTKE